MFDIRIREHTPAGDRGRVVSTLEVDSTDAESATSTMSFTTSARVADRMEAPFVIGLEYTTGSDWQKPRNDLFVILSDAEDSKDIAEAMRFTAQGYVPWLLSKALHWWDYDSADDRSRKWEGTPGYVMRRLIDEAHGLIPSTSTPRGWAPQLDYDFTDTHDSLGQPWTADDHISMELPLWRSYSSIVSSWVEAGYFEWWAEGTTLRLARVGTGDDLTETVVLGGPAFNGAPAKTDFSGTFSTIVLIPDGSSATHAFNAGADTRFGSLETSMTMSGISDHGTAVRQAQPVMSENRAKKLELSYDWTPSAAGPIPWVDFTIGDTITARRRSGRQPQRVIGLQVTKREEGVSARAIVGSKLVALQAKLAKRVGAVATGQLIGGSGDALPANPGPAPLEPAPPTAVHVASNSGWWKSDGSAASTVQIAWNAVNTSIDGSPLGIDLYEVASRVEGESLQTETATAALSATFEQWTPGATRVVAVRARSVAGAWSAWSEEIAVVPDVPSSIVPNAPTGLIEVTNIGSFMADGSARSTITVAWDEVTHSTDGTLVDIQAYEVWVGDARTRVEGRTHSFTVPAGTETAVQVRALTTLDVWGDPTEILTVSGAAPALVLGEPSAPLLTPGLGGVAARWDGLLEGAVPPSGFGYVVMETAAAEGGPWSMVGTPLVAAGGAVIRAAIGQSIWVRLRSIDTLGRPGGTSEAAAATAEGVSLSDIDPDLADELEEIRATADGKNRIYTSTDEPIAPPSPGFAQGDQWWELDETGASIVGVHVWNGVDWVDYLLVADRIIAAESITGPLIKANTIQVSHVEAGFGDSLNITANGSVTTIINQQATQAGQLATTQADVNQASQAAQDAAQAASGAQAGVNNVQGQVTSLQGQQAATAGQVSNIQVWFRVDGEGAHVGRSDSAFQTHIKADRFEITQDGVPRAWLEANRLVAPEFVGLTVVLSNHKLEQFGTGTVVRRLG